MRNIQVLNYREFIQRVPRSGSSGAVDPRYGNFFLYFLPAAVNTRRLTVPFLRLQHNLSALEHELSCELMAAREKDCVSRVLPALETKLYEAYCYMRTFAASDEELFT